MTERSRDNLRIAAKVIGVFIVLLGMLFLVRTVAMNVRTEPSGQPSTSELIANAVYALFLFLTFIVPLMLLRSELRRRR